MRILAFVIETVFQWLVGAALLRAWMNGLRLNMRAQPGLFVMALTDWIVKPLRRWLPQSMAKSRTDWGSVLAALLLSVACALLLRALMAPLAASAISAYLLASWPIGSLLFLVRTGLQMFSLILLGWVLLSWLQPGSSLYSMFSRLVGPLVAPLRRWLPPIGGVDLSPLVLLLVLQVAVMVLG